MGEEVQGRMGVHLTQVLQGRVAYMDLMMAISQLLMR